MATPILVIFVLLASPTRSTLPRHSKPASRANIYRTVIPTRRASHQGRRRLGCLPLSQGAVRTAAAEDDSPSSVQPSRLGLRRILPPKRNSGQGPASDTNDNEGSGESGQIRQEEEADEKPAMGGGGGFQGYGRMDSVRSRQPDGISSKPGTVSTSTSVKFFGASGSDASTPTKRLYNVPWELANTQGNGENTSEPVLLDLQGALFDALPVPLVRALDYEGAEVVGDGESRAPSRSEMFAIRLNVTATVQRAPGLNIAAQVGGRRQEVRGNLRIWMIRAKYECSLDDMPSDSMIQSRLNTKYDVMKSSIVNLDGEINEVKKSFVIRKDLKLDPVDGIWKSDDTNERYYLWFQTETEMDAPRAMKHTIKLENKVIYTDTDIDAKRRSNMRSQPRKRR